MVIPAGSNVTLTIGKLEPGSEQVRPEGRVQLNVSSVIVNGTAIGAAAGQVIGKNTKSTPIVFALTQSLSIAAK